MPSVTKDLAKRHSTEGVQSPSQLAGQSPGLTGDNTCFFQGYENFRAPDALGAVGRCT